MTIKAFLQIDCPLLFLFIIKVLSDMCVGWINYCKRQDNLVYIWIILSLSLSLSFFFSSFSFLMCLFMYSFLKSHFFYLYNFTHFHQISKAIKKPI